MKEFNKTNKNRRIPKIYEGLIIIISYVLLQKIIGVFLLIQIDKLKDAGTFGAKLYSIFQLEFISMFLLYLIFIIIFFFIYRVDIKLKFQHFKLESFFKKISIYAIKLISLILILNLIINNIFPNISSESSLNQQVVLEALKTPTIPMILTIVLIAPIMEEIVFRYALMSLIFYKLPKYLNIIISSTIFTLVHIGLNYLFNGSYAYFTFLLLSYLPVSLFLSYVYIKEKNLIYSISTHILNNSIALLSIILLAKHI